MKKTYVTMAGLLAVTSALGCGGGGASGDPLSGTTWVTTTLPASQAANIAAFRESITFGTSTSTTATGPATLTFSITDTAAATTPGCMEAWTFAGCTWSDNGSGTTLTFTLNSCTGSVTRTGCTTATDNAAAMADTHYDFDVNGGFETFMITGSSAVASGNSGTPFNVDTYTFTRM